MLTYLTHFTRLIEALAGLLHAVEVDRRHLELVQKPKKACLFTDGNKALTVGPNVARPELRKAYEITLMHEGSCKNVVDIIKPA